MCAGDRAGNSPAAGDPGTGHRRHSRTFRPALQGLLRNPLASPSLFGAPQSAAVRRGADHRTGFADVRSWALPVSAIVAAFASVFVLLVVAGRGAGLLLLILAGLAISSLAGAATALVMNLSSNPFAALEIAFWLLGSLEIAVSAMWRWHCPSSRRAR